MICVYNDTEQPQWELITVNKNISKFTTIDRTCGVDIVNNDFALDLPNLSTVKEMCDSFDVEILSYSDTAMRFEIASMYPIIRSGKDNFNSDIILVSIDISDGLKLINHKIAGMFIYAYSYSLAEKRLHLVIGATELKDRNSYCELYFKSANDKFIIMRCLIYDKDFRSYKIITRMKAIDKNPEKGKRGHIDTRDYSVDGTYTIKPYLPLRPGNKIIVPNMECVENLSEGIAKKYKITTKRIEFIDKTSDEMIQRVRWLVRYGGYKAITIYDDSKSFDEMKALLAKTNYADYLAEYSDMFKHKYFDIIFLICNDMKTIRLK